jgi:transposase
LTLAQQAAFKSTLLTSCPQDHGLEGRIWTGTTMKAYLYNTYQVAYTSGIYDLLERLNLSDQKAHAD